MKKFFPFVLPAVALLIVGFLIWRWYGDRTNRPSAEISKFGEGVEIENLSDKAVTPTNGVVDYKTADLKAEGGATAAGQIRYELADGKVRFSVMATLPELKTGEYQVWLKDPSSEAIRKAFALVADKGGWVGSAAISAETLPFEVIVSSEERPDNTLETVMLRGLINKE
jgi:hypothetical protein